ncbi:hypothetical protein [Mesorhizobium sp.]|uniref:hypothetical protein n=2 Tax=unclassified Mesorhizobium TaxID=325217 RepID=UPI000FE9183A|nr:hypothetical protein [Mesorhizobium sp.]RWO78837.1 MAG: hypothetical protein EOQ96_29765 [Mesorhizobium sp.]
MASSETLLPIDVPPSSAAAPLPHVFADERRLLVAYVAHRPDPKFDGTNPRSISSVTGDQSIVILTAEPYLALQFGPSNDEAISGHRLYGLGLQPYSAFEVLNSTWISSFEKANRVHTSHTPELFSGYQHFVLTFHDSTLEFITENFSASLHQGAVLPALMESVGHAVPTRRVKPTGFFSRLLGRG